jgi:hypothetical protein
VRQSCVYLSPGCEINFATLSSTFGVQNFPEYDNYPRTWNLEHGLELQHELMPRLSLTGSWFHGAFHDMQTTINRALVFDGDPRLNPHFTPFTVYDPQDGKAIPAYGLNFASRPAVNPTRNLDTLDPDRQQIYNAYNIEFKARPGAGSQIFGGISFERELNVNCTAPDNPNSLRFCDQTNLEEGYSVPFRKTLKLAGSIPIPWGFTLSAALQSNVVGGHANSLEFTSTTNYPASCAAPCPAGQRVVQPTGVMTQTSLTIALDPTPTVLDERITQLDFKVQRTFRFGRVSVLPTLEVFNINNSDAIISYQGTNYLAPGSYMAPNSIMQPRMVGVGATVRW